MVVVVVVAIMDFVTRRQCQQLSCRNVTVIDVQSLRLSHESSKLERTIIGLLLIPRMCAVSLILTETCHVT